MAAELVILVNNSKLHSAFAATVSQQFESKLSLSSHINTDIDKIADDGALIIPLGSSLCKRSIERFRKNQVFCQLLTRKQYSAIIQKSEPRISAIFIDQSIERFIQLVKHSLAQGAKTGILLSNSTAHLQKSIDQAASQYSLAVDIQVIEKAELVDQISVLLSRVDALLTIPDKQVLNRSTIKSIFLSSYLKKKPVFSYSTSYVKAGAVAAIFSTPRDLSDALIDELSNYKKDKTLPKPASAKLFSIEINQDVAHSLGMDQLDEDRLKELIK